MISLLIVIALVGLVAWALTYFIPMPPKIATLVQVVAAVCILLYVLQWFGVVGDLGPRRR